MMEQWLETMLKSLAEFATSMGLKILAAIVLLIVGLKLIGWLVKTMANSKAVGKLDQGVQTFLRSFIRIALLVLLVVMIASILGVPTTSFAALLASAGVAIGLAFQGSLSNLAGGLMILIFHPFRVGDYIQTNSVEGTVMEITVFYTILNTVDNKQLTLPNGTLTNSAITNYSTKLTRRVDMEFAVAYDSDMEQVKSILLEIASKHPKTLEDPEPFARLLRQDDSALVFILRAWVNTPDYWSVYFDFNEQVKTAFDKAEISIPFPQLDVHAIQQTNAD